MKAPRKAAGEIPKFPKRGGGEKNEFRGKFESIGNS
jgi:hypothetical protein